MSPDFKDLLFAFNAHRVEYLVVGAQALAAHGRVRATGPLTERAHLVRTGIECSPCFQRDCPLVHHKCMTELTPERVLAEISEVEASAS